ncbi:DUF89 family protein [bacterium]|nr:DUF89 family protein [bacterium]
MKTFLDCIPCFVRQTLQATREVSADPETQERMLREILRWTSEMDLNQSPPELGQRIHRRLRELIAQDDPYREAKERQNRMALRILDEVREDAFRGNAFEFAVRLAAAGNSIDLAFDPLLSDGAVRTAVQRSLKGVFVGDIDAFRRVVESAKDILFLADNAGEIVFDRLLIEHFPPGKTTVAVRGAPIINDATHEDAKAIGLDRLAEIIDNGSDAPGTILSDCSPQFRERFDSADLIIAKGQGNYETLSEEHGPLYFLFKAKCPVIADHAGLPLGAHILVKNKNHMPRGGTVTQ